MNVTDYQRVARAIRYLETHATAQPSLADVASAQGLSPFHFQRLFRRWAGVSPKRFLQFVTAHRAKDALQDGKSVLAAAYDAGLSGPSRLHDLLISLDAVTPGEFKRSGDGIEIRHGFHDSPFGPYLLALTDRGICGLEFTTGGRRAALTRLRARWPHAHHQEDHRATAGVARHLFPREPGIPHQQSLFVSGTNFQVKVWEAVLRVPAGYAVTYADLAGAIGNPGAAQAVGGALARNPVAALIPCHRVLRATGSLGGYRWGADRKRAMVAWEAARKVG